MLIWLLCTLLTLQTLQVHWYYYLLQHTYAFVIERIQDVGLFNDVSTQAVF